MICPESATLQVGELRCASDALALNFYTSLLHSPIFNVSVDRASLTRGNLNVILFCAISRNPNHTNTEPHRGIITKSGYRTNFFLENTIILWKIQEKQDILMQLLLHSKKWAILIPRGWNILRDWGRIRKQLPSAPPSMSSQAPRKLLETDKIRVTFLALSISFSVGIQLIIDSMHWKIVKMQNVH